MESVKHLMMEEYDNMTSVEQAIADFFIKNEEYMDFSARNISRILYISNATLSRFAKKCGYKGYRELVFDYEKELQEQLSEDSISKLAKKVKNTYSSPWELGLCGFRNGVQNDAAWSADSGCDGFTGYPDDCSSGR